MKMCQPHWVKLKAAIDARGLSYAKSGEQLVGKIEAGQVDHLMAAHNAIVGNALDVAGLALMQPNEDGSERCPLCFLQTCQCGDPECSSRFENWIERAADDEQERRRASQGGAT